MKPSTEEGVEPAMSKGKTFAAFSGGKDSVEMAYRMRDAGEDFELLFTPTGNELPELLDHIERVRSDLGVPLSIPKGPSLLALIEEFNALPNWRQRWCTRMIKIVPCIVHLAQHPRSVLCVGLRADEEARLGLYGAHATYRYPLREHGLDLAGVLGSLKKRGVSIPARTDCAWCYGQRLYEWHDLWLKHPDIYAQGEALEVRTGHTFRSAQRDTWPASLAELRARFEKGDVPKRRRLHVEQEACRVCRV